MTYDYDLFVIGAGSGGVRAARLAAQAGFKVACAEESKPGGTCVVRGCVPKKFFVYASEFGHAMQDAKGYGWSFPGGEPSHDWPSLREAVQSEVGRLSSIYTNILERNGVEHIAERAVVTGPNSLRVGEREVTAERILVAVGGRPTRDDSIEGAELGIVSDDAFLLDELPKRAVIAGGGYIAIEFAFILAGLGVDVTLVYRGSQVLRGFDRDLGAYVESQFERAGITYVNNTVFTKIEGTKDGEKTVYLKNGSALKTDLVFWAIGRTPNTSGLGLEAAGVELDAQGAVLVDEDNQSSAPSIFAIGDVTNRVNLTPVAIREAVAFVETQLKKNHVRMDYHNIPMAVFAQPPVSSVGLTGTEARAAGHDPVVYKTDFRPMKNVLAQNPERMMMKLVVDKKTDCVLGCHIAGTDGPEMIQIAAIAVKAGVTKAEFDHTCALHPTAAEEIVTMTAVVEE
jgi:glutathione reductase (NADPH)